jgi:methyl-accepting chemotaxis protein
MRLVANSNLADDGGGIMRAPSYRWGSSIKAKLLLAFAILTLLALSACGLSIILFNQVEDVFAHTVTHTVKGYTSAVRLQEEARQLNHAAVAFGTAGSRKEVDELGRIVDQLHHSTDAEVGDLREAGLDAEADELGAALQTIYKGFETMRAISTPRVAAMERRGQLAAAVVPTANQLNGAIDPQFFGDTLDLSISLQGDLIPAGDEALREKRAGWAAEVDRLQHMLQFRVAASLASSLLSDTSVIADANEIASLQERFAAAAETMERFLPAFKQNHDDVASLTANLIGVGRGDANIFKLRTDELAAIADEGRVIAQLKADTAALGDRLRELIQDRRLKMRQAVEQSKGWLGKTKLALGLIAIASIVASVIVIFLYVGRRIIRRLSAITHAMTALAAGDNNVQVPSYRDGDEIGDMAKAVVVFQERAVAAKALTGEVTESIRSVANASGQASQAVGQVSDGSNAQLTALQQSAQALEQSTQAIADVARSTHLASEQARQSASLVAGGIERIRSMVGVVTAISENTKQISKFAEAIQRIASQTNMLALNAAIEAARAGEHGKGFTVVAEEVRKLAEGSRGLAEDISGEVRQAEVQAEKGVQMSAEVQGMMQEIAVGVRETDKLIGAIAAAMEEQQMTVAGINRNVAELTRIGQSNATAAEEIAATMLDLSKLAERTRDKVDQFEKIGL